MSAYQYFENFSAYASAKAGIVAMTKCLAAEGVKAYSICPGGVETPFRKKLAKNTNQPADSSKIEIGGPLLSPFEIAEIVDDILSEKYQNGSSILIRKNDIFLCDSGAQYLYGTTDVTRTICFSKPKKYIKEIFTKVLKGHISIVTANLNKKFNGKLLDPLARKYLIKSGLDYKHGTGHGVGYYLNVHEGPQAISKFNTIKFQEGMILSNEPGFYKKGSFGIRIENLVYIKKINKKLFFENLTLAPIDKELINLKNLVKKEKDYLFK